MSKMARVGDEGQRYVVSATMGTKKHHKRMDIGYCTKMEAVYELIKAIYMHPSMSNPVIVDREVEDFEAPDYCKQCIFYIWENGDCVKHEKPVCSHDTPCKDGIMSNLHRSD